MHLNEKDFTSIKPSKSPYFDTKHYTFTIDNVVQWAKVNNKIVKLSLADFLYLLVKSIESDELINVFGYFLDYGSESIAFKNEDKNKVYKIIFDRGIHKDPWEIAKNKIVKHNRVFPETAYKISHVLHVPWRIERKDILKYADTDLYFYLGLAEDTTTLPKYDYWPVLCQDILNTKDVNTSTYHISIDDYLKNKGFKGLDSQKKIYKKGRTYVDDLHRQNIGLDKEGNYRVFDAIISTNPKDFEEIMGEIIRKW